MKKIALNIFALGIIASAFTACDDAKNDVIDNMVYIGEAASEPSTEIVLGQVGEQNTTTLNVRLARPVAVDTKVTIALDENTLASYNKLHQTEFQIIPAENISYPTEVVIPAGSTAAQIAVDITSFAGEAGVDYAAPLKLMSSDGTQLSNATSSYIITFGKILRQYCPKFFYNNAMTMNWDSPVDLSNFTLEWWVRSNGFSINNQALFAFQSNYELYVRFGDIVYVDEKTGRNLFNFLQIKTMGIDANYDSGNPNSNPLPANEWIHFAHTYDASTGDVVLYMNGTEVNRANGGAGKIFTFSGLNMFSSGSSYFYNRMEMCQLRMWKTTRTPAQIQKFMKKEVKYNDPNLVFYLPMNEGEGHDTLHDVTGNGHDCVIGSNKAAGGNNKYAQAWTEYTFE